MIHALYNSAYTGLAFIGVILSDSFPYNLFSAYILYISQCLECIVYLIIVLLEVYLSVGWFLNYRHTRDSVTLMQTLI